MNNKPDILVFIDWYLPGFKAGGPVRSVAAIIESLKNEACFSIVTGDRDLGDKLPYRDIITDQWTISPDGINIIYCSPAFISGSRIEKILKEKKYDVIYFNSVFSVNYTIRPLRHIRRMKLSSRVILAPRGMLGEGALRIKPLRKKLFLTYARCTGLYKNILWHASSEQEAAEINKIFGKKALTRVGMNLSVPSENKPVKINKQKGAARFIYLSRISKKKNLLFFIDRLLEMPADVQVNLEIIGPVEDLQYWRQCQTLIEKLPRNIVVIVRDEIPPASVNTFLSASHFFILPTLHENFGHVIIESLSAGRPVIISDQTPWKDLEKESTGWDISLSDIQAWNKAMLTAVNMDQETYDQWSGNAKEKARTFLENKQALEPFRELFSGK